MGSVFLMNLGLDIYKLYNAIFDVSLKKSFYLAKFCIFSLMDSQTAFLFKMSSTTSTYVFFYYLESPIITLYREKKVYENVTCNDL